MSLDNSLNYNCIAKDRDFPTMKLCKYTGRTPRKTELLSNKLDYGDIFVLAKLQDIPTFYEDSWISISVEEIRELKDNSEGIIDIVKPNNSHHRGNKNDRDYMKCAFCDSGIEKVEEYRLIYGYHILNFHRYCYEEFRRKLVSFTKRSGGELVSYTI